MKSFHIRLAELTRKRSSDNTMTDKEEKEIRECEHQNMVYVESVIAIQAMIGAAELVGDTKWARVLYAQLDYLESDPHLTKVKYG